MSHVKPKKKTAKRKYRKPLGYDFTVLFIVLILVLFGVVMIFSSSYYYTMTTERFHNDMFYFLKRQSLWAVLGIVAMVGMMHIPYTLWRRFAKLAYWLSNLFTALCRDRGRRAEALAVDWLAFLSAFGIYENCRDSVSFLLCD